MEYLDEHGVKPCAHSAVGKKLLMSVDTSCNRSEVPYQLLYSIRGNTNDKNTGVLGRWGDGWEVADGQHIKTSITSTIRCKNKSMNDPCTLRPDFTWKKMSEGERVFLVRGKDRGRPCWHYVLLVDDEETKEKFREKVKSGSLDVADYGQVLQSGWGENPPNEVKDRIHSSYNIIYD